MCCPVHVYLQGGGCCVVLECTARSVQPAQLRDGGTLVGWHVISLQCAALKEIVRSKLPKGNRRRSKPARKAVVSIEGEQQDEADSDVMQRSSPTSTAIPTPNESDKQVHEDVYWKHQLDRPRTRSTNPYSEAIYNSKKNKEERERLNKWADISTSDKRLVALEEQAKKNKRQARRKQDGRVVATQLLAEQSEGKAGAEEQADGGEEEQAQGEGRGRGGCSDGRWIGSGALQSVGDAGPARSQDISRRCCRSRGGETRQCGGEERSRSGGLNYCIAHRCYCFIPSLSMLVSASRCSLSELSVEAVEDGRVVHDATENEQR